MAYIMVQDDGDRRGGVQDIFGNKWFLARHLGNTAQ
jgi:hypothetical protein